MDNLLVIIIITLMGAVAGTFVPYVIKVYQDPDISFDVNYGYALLLSIFVAVFGIVPDEVPVLTIKIMLGAFLTGYGLQSIINKAVPYAKVRS